MEDDEPVLLHEPDLMLAILRAAQHAPASLDDAMARLHANFAAAHEPLTEPEGDLRRRPKVWRCFSGAPTRSQIAGDGQFRLTARGARLLDEHPGGVDESLLYAFPEFRAFLTALSPKRIEDDPRLPAFQPASRRSPIAARSPTIPMPSTASTISPGSAAGPRHARRTSKGDVGHA